METRKKWDFISSSQACRCQPIIGGDNALSVFALAQYSFICRDTSTRRQRSDHFGLRVKLPPDTTRPL